MEEKEEERRRSSRRRRRRNVLEGGGGGGREMDEDRVGKMGWCFWNGEEGIGGTKAVRTP